MKNCILLGLLIGISTLSAQQPFDCDEGNFYQVISGVMKAYDPITGSYSESLHSYAAYNAGGYNPQDHYLYAIKNSDKHLLRIAKDQVVDLGAIRPSGTTAFGGGYAADVDQYGNLWVFQNTNKKTFHKITNLKGYNGSTSPVFEVVEADIATPSTCADIAFVNGNIYGGSRGKLYKWDLSSGVPVFSSISVANLPSSTFGAAYADAQDRLYLSDNSGGLYLIHDYHSTTPYATLLNLTETTNSNDGFKCASGKSPLDKDQDGILDALDADSDGDGISNLIECQGIDPFGDDDQDDMYNYLDHDISGNGDHVVQDAFDRDGDGIPDFFDIDSDNDGILDIEEAGQGHRDTNSDGQYNASDVGYKDGDVDGMADAFDPDQGGTALVPLDSDNDAIFDCYDIDSDNDGIVDLIEGQRATLFTSLSGVDVDKDGLDDAFDPDFEGQTNGLVNTDGKDNFDHLDTDSDNDGVLDSSNAYDSNGDGIPETRASGMDSDQDGLDDSFDLRKSDFDPSNAAQTPDSFPVPEICNRYQYLGKFDAAGRPLYLDQADVVSRETIDRVHNALPEGYPVPDFNPHYISSGYDTDLIVKEKAELWVTFIGEGAGYKNTLGYYTYDIQKPQNSLPAPEDITIIFPNVSAVGSGGGLQIGDKVKIGSFGPNTGIGWVLLANAWADGCVGTGHWQLHSNPDYNPENNPALRYHNVLLSDPEHQRIILGFEDIRRDYAYCDQDFNDALFYVTANPYSALDTDNHVQIDSATDVTSANDGGLESNGDLANLIAQRNFIRAKTAKRYNAKKAQQPFRKGYKTALSQNLSSYFPETGMFGTEIAHVSSPEDLVGMTNANALFSVDYYQSENRVAAGLATVSLGSIYDHSKTICDRLNGSRLLDIRTVKIRNHTLISSKIERETKEIEYALTFSVKKGASENEIYSLWNIADYPEGEYINFQLWGGSMAQVANLANHVLDAFISQKPLRSHEVTHRIPTVFIEKGSYELGVLRLIVVNKQGAANFNFEGNIRKTEGSQEVSISKQVALSGANREEVNLNIGPLFDIGFSVTEASGSQRDALYLADGPWGIDYDTEGVSIANFEISPWHGDSTTENHTLERAVLLEGEVRTTVNVFRNFRPGNLTLDVRAYNAIQFDLNSSRPIEVILVPKNLDNWSKRLRYTIPANPGGTTHTISWSDFYNGSHIRNQITDLRTVVFSVQGDYMGFQHFDFQVSNVRLVAKSMLGTSTMDPMSSANLLKNYPNPFHNTTTVSVPKISDQQVVLTVLDMFGRLVRNEIKVVSANATITFEAQDLKTGIYNYSIRAKNGIYKGKFMIH